MLNLPTDVSFKFKNFDIIKESPKRPSEKAKHLAQLFISNMGKEILEQLPIKSEGPLLSEEDRKQILNIFTPEIIEKLSDDNLFPGFYLVGKGHYHRVWGHEKYPDLVFKLMDQEAAKKQESVAQMMFQKTQGNGSLIQIPRATRIDTETETSIYIEDLLPLCLNSDEHKEFWARVLTHYQSNSSDSFKTNLGTLIDQITNLVCTTGFWDVGIHNLPEVRKDGKGVCGTDFDNVNLLGKHIALGLENLANTFPISPLVDGIVSNYKQEYPKLLEDEIKNYEEWVKHLPKLKKPTTDKIHWDFKIKLEVQNEHLKALQEAIQYYDQKKYQSGSESIPSCDLFSFQEVEQAIAKDLLSRIDIKLLKNQDAKTTISNNRSIHYQPFVETALKLSQIDSLLRVLNSLKEQKILVSWSSDYSYHFVMGTELDDLKYAAYTIRF